MFAPWELLNEEINPNPHLKPSWTYFSQVLVYQIQMINNTILRQTDEFNFIKHLLGFLLFLCCNILPLQNCR